MVVHVAGGFAGRGEIRRRLAGWEARDGGEAVSEERKPVTNAELETALRKLKGLLSDDGEYGIRRSDGEKMCMGEAIMLGDLFAIFDAWLLQQATQAVRP